MRIDDCRGAQGSDAQRAPNAASLRQCSSATEPLAVRGVIFEMAGVLYDATVWRRWLVQLLGRLGLVVEYHAFYVGWEQRYLVDVICGRRDFGEALQAFLLESGLTWGQIDEIEAASRRRLQELEAEARPLPGVATIVSQLADAGLSLVVLANSPFPASLLQTRLRRMGLDHAISAVLSSFELEAAKPEPICYQAALEALSLEPQEVLFVGQRGDDLAGAAAVGMRTVAVNHAPDVVADVRLHSFSQLPRVVLAPTLAC